MHARSAVAPPVDQSFTILVFTSFSNLTSVFLDFSTGSAPSLSEFRIVLLGQRCVQISAVGNTILGRNVFDLKTRAPLCVTGEGDVSGRRVIVVQPPGWCPRASFDVTAELTKKEIMLSTSLCPPGPHVFLLVIWANSCFDEEQRKRIESHVVLLGDKVWSHTMILFICGAWLGDTAIEQYIESEGKALQSVVEKCRNRYHVLNNHSKADTSQVSILMDKIEEITAGNSGAHYEIDAKELEEIFDEKGKEEERAKERKLNVEKQRLQILAHTQCNDIPKLPEIRIVLLEYIQNSSSSVGNTILGREEFDVKRRIANCVQGQGEVEGRQVTVVKAPAWKGDLKDTAELTKQAIVLSMSLCPPGPHAVLLLLRGNSFKEEDRVNVQKHLELLGKDIWNHTMVLFTQGNSMVGMTIEQYIESEGKGLQWLAEKCGNRYHSLNTRDKEDTTQVTQLLGKIEEMVAGNGGRHFEMDPKTLEETKNRRKKEEEEAKERRIKIEMHHHQLKSLKREFSYIKCVKLLFISGIVKMTSAVNCIRIGLHSTLA